MNRLRSRRARRPIRHANVAAIIRGNNAAAHWDPSYGVLSGGASWVSRIGGHAMLAYADATKLVPNPTGLDGLPSMTSTLANDTSAHLASGALLGYFSDNSQDVVILREPAAGNISAATSALMEKYGIS